MLSVYTSGFEFIFILQQVQNLQGSVVLCKQFLSWLHRDPHPQQDNLHWGLRGDKKILGGGSGGGQSLSDHSLGHSSCFPV